MGQFWVSQNVGNENWFLSLFRQRIQDIYRQEWNCDINSTSNNRLYKHVKKNHFCYENYLSMPNKPLRLALTKIRLSSHLFNIERGRWGVNKLDVKERICTYCNVIEDEYHCLIKCPCYQKERDGLLAKILRRKPSMYKFVI